MAHQEGLDHKGEAGEAAVELVSASQTDVKGTGPGLDAATILRYPTSMGEAGDEQREMMRFTIKSRDDLDDNKLTIYLYTPPGIALADAAAYSSSEFGWIGGVTDMFQDLGPQLFQGAGFMGVDTDVAGSMLSGLTTAGGIALKSKYQTKFGDMSIIKQGAAVNPNTNLSFDGVGLRSFTFSFKLVAEDEAEAKVIRHIENSFRKFLYPSRALNNLILRYPPYWQIQFMKADAEGMQENPYLPFIDLCYLRGVTCTYNSSTNAFHTGGAPVELDMSLSFDEAQQNTREDLYTEAGGENINYETADYTRQRAGITSKAMGD